MRIDKVATLLILLFGLLLILLIIPDQIEEIDYGRIVPKTVPLAAALTIIVCAAVQLLLDNSMTKLNSMIVIRSVLFLGLIGLGVYFMPVLGFEFVAPVIALLVMLLIRERRWYWFAIGCLVIPVSVWLIVEQLLGRTLP